MVQHPTHAGDACAGGTRCGCAARCCTAGGLLLHGCVRQASVLQCFRRAPGYYIPCAWNLASTPWLLSLRCPCACVPRLFDARQVSLRLPLPSLLIPQTWWVHSKVHNRRHVCRVATFLDLWWTNEHAPLIGHSAQHTNPGALWTPHQHTTTCRRRLTAWITMGW